LQVEDQGVHRRFLQRFQTTLAAFSYRIRIRQVDVRWDRLGSGGDAMKESQLLDRITVSSRVMVGKPVIKGTRLTVDYILNLLAHGEAVEGILEEYEGLTREDVRACLLFAATPA
jgi:uncharacterized protein (DUF433 family)